MMSRAAKKGDHKIMVAKGAREKEAEQKVTEVPPIAESHIQEIEVTPIMDGYSNVRIKYSTINNEYLYEAIEPKLSDDEERLLAQLSQAMVDGFEALGEGA